MDYLEQHAARRWSAGMMQPMSDLMPYAGIKLRCPACHAKLRTFEVHSLGRNLRLEGICHRCGTRIFAIRRTPAWMLEGHLEKKQRMLDFIDQAA